MATSKIPLSTGNTHDGKNFHMFAKGTRSKKHGFKYPKGRKSGRSCSEMYPDGERRK